MAGKNKLAAALAGIIGDSAEQVGIKNWLTTGVPELDAALSGMFDGGAPGGRMIEIFGPASSGKTFLATMIMKAAQDAGGIAGFSDHERSFEPKLAASLGMDVDPNNGTFVYKRPETFEESIALATTFAEQVRKQKLIPDDAPLVWVFDSVASMIPYEKLYDAKGKRRVAGDYNMRDKLALASATSQSYPHLAQWAEDYNMTVILLNQIRMKPGVMYGDPTCLHGNVKVPFVDGSYATMREIVEQRIEKDVWAFNEQTGQFEAKPIIGWHDNGEIPDVADWIHIETRGVHTRNGRVGFTATPDHNVLTVEGKWVTAAELSVGDKLITRRVSKLNGTLEQFLRAAMSGDAHVLRSDGRNGVVLRIQDNEDQEYMRWKVAKLSPFFEFNKGFANLKGKQYEFWATKRAHEDLKIIDDELRGNRCPLQALDVLSPMGLAVWVMDDAFYDEAHKRYSLSVKRFARSPDLTRLADRLFDLGFDFGVRRGEGRFDFTVESSRKLAELICEFVPPCMERKLPADLRGRYVDFDLTCEEIVSPEEVEITEIRPLGEKAARINCNRYDITVADHHNYMVGSRQNGVIVHNCTPGGGAAEFYASIRVSLGRKMITNGEKDADKKETLGQEITANVVKNKVTRPFQRAKWRVMYNMKGFGAYVDVVSSTLDFLVRKNLIPKDGNYLLWEGKKKYQVQIEKELQGDPDAMKKLRAFFPASVDDLTSYDAESEALPTEGGETEMGAVEDEE